MVAGAGDEAAVVRLLGPDLDREKMYSVKVYRKDGRVALYDSKITRTFFFANEAEREVDTATDFQTLRRLQQGFVGFWLRYKYEPGYGGQIRYKHFYCFLHVYLWCIHT